MVLVFFVGLNNVSKADTYYMYYQGFGFVGGSVLINGCPPGTSGPGCQGGNVDVGTPTSYYLSHTVTLSTNKKVYTPNEPIYISYNSNNLDINCDNTYYWSSPIGDIDLKNLNVGTWTTHPEVVYSPYYSTPAYSELTNIVFNSPSSVGMFSVNNLGSYRLIADFFRNPITYTDTCKGSTFSFDIKDVHNYADPIYGNLSSFAPAGGISTDFEIKLGELNLK